MQRLAVPAATALDDPSLYFNRELSWLEFNRRVLEEAQDPSVPLLERLKFLAIFESNLDEFFMVRVGGLQQKVQSGISYGSGADRMPVKEQLERIALAVREMTDQTYRCLLEEVLPGLEREGIVLRGPRDLTRRQPHAFGRGVPPRGLPRADAVGHRSGPPVSAAAQQIAQPRRHPAAARAGRKTVRRRASAERPAALRGLAGRAGTDAAPRLRAAGYRHPHASGRTVPRHDASSTTPSSA